MARSSGLAANPLQARRAGRGTGLISALATPEPQTAPVAELAPNPDNPDARSMTATEADHALVASVQSIGVVQPLIVQTARVFLSTHPDHAQAVGERPWVILAGHRRHAAAATAGLAAVPILVRDDIDTADAVMLHENLHRSGLAPSEEARAYARLIDRHDLSQRALATQLGVPQSQISKRLALLTLPDPFLAQVDAGDLDLADAVEIARALEPHRDDTEVLVALETARLEALTGRRGRAGDLVATVVRDVSNQRELATIQATEPDLPVVDPEEQFTFPYRHQLTKAADIQAARTAGTLVVGIYAGGVKHFTTSSPSTPSASEAMREENRERGRARKARRAALAHVVTRRDLVKITADLRTQALIRGVGLNAQVTRLAHQLAHEARIGPHGDNLTDWEWRKAIADLTDPTVLDQLAAVIALAAHEDAASWTHHTWTNFDRAYLAWLAQYADYQPTAWEQSRLDAIGDPA